jgi:putative tRNA adenosine deaminase-associated protein
VSYFAAAFSRSSESDWEGFDVDLDEVESLDELADAVHEAVEEADAEDEMVVLLLEQPDEWFAVVRVDADEEPRVFVSDAQAALRHALGEVLLPDLLPPIDEDLDALAGSRADDESSDTDAGEPGLAEDAAANALLTRQSAPAGPSGDAGLLRDLGMDARELDTLTHPGEVKPGEALTVIAEQLGFVDAFEAVR